MLRITELSLPLDHEPSALREEVLRRMGIQADALVSHCVVRRSHDARKRSDIRRIYTVDVEVRDEAAVLARTKGDPRVTLAPDTRFSFDLRAPEDCLARPVIVGTGPCGLLAGLLLSRLGFRPILLERGRRVRERTQDTWDLWRRGTLHAESNVQFGEGGAGTFSDGKIYTQTKDPHHYGRKVLEEFVEAGASPDILIDAKPHIGTFRLVGIVERMRKTIEELGGEVRFGSRVETLEIEGQRVAGVRLADGSHVATRHVLLAIGHSARDTLMSLHAQGVRVEPKAFSIGVRIEHPQSLIDRARFGQKTGHPALGPADYKLVHHASNGRTVYSFCMCPGGVVVAAASEAGGVVTNGMSQPARNDRNANAALVVGVTPADFPQDSPLGGILFQRHWESMAFQAGGETYAAPAQRVGDFLAGRPSTGPGRVLPSYTPGVHWTDLSLCLPAVVVAALREAIPAFERQVRGFAMDDAVLTGVETRTSSPVRIPRDGNFESVALRGLYPAGEGAGYAGGILSAGIDGLKAAQAIVRSIIPSSK